MIVEFMNQKTSRSKNSFVRQGELYIAFSKYCLEKTVEPVTQSKFNQVLSKMKYELISLKNGLTGKKELVWWNLKLN